MKNRNENPKPAIIIYQRLGCIYVRRRPAQVHDPHSPRQQLQRERFSLAVETAKLYADQLGPRWHSYAHRHHKTGLNLLVGQIMRLAITTDPESGGLVVDTSKIDLEAPWK